MSTTVIGVFDARRVEQVTGELKQAGFADRDLEVIGGTGGELVSSLVERGFDDESARGYADAAARGSKLLAASGPEDRVRRAAEIMERHEGKAEGPAPAETTTVPVAEENLTVDKHRTVQGGVRVTSHVEETPVEQTVKLREEHVEVERRPADRKLTPEEADKVFQDRTVEMTETAEEVEVGKEARVVEEVALRKRAEETEERVKDTVRRTEVEVEQLKPSRAKHG
jgi:uncharacterized protein (TIGR02271 family)